jgi:di/tricarboxylate transporter
MTTQIALVLVILLIATALLVTERLRSDVIALLTLVALALTGLVKPEEAFSGFSRSAVITILSIFIITAALDRTGVTGVIGNRLLRLAGGREGRLIPVIMLAGAALSLFMNNIAAGAVLLPAVIGISRQTQVKPSKLLMPLSFATMLGGMATLLTTSNILVGNALRDAGLKGFALFDFAPVGVPLLVVGIIYMTLIGRGLLPNRDVAGPIRRATPKELAELYGLHKGVCHIYVLMGSGIAGQTIAQGGWSDRLGLTVIGVSRGGQTILSPGKNFVVIEGDVVLVGGQTDDTELSYFGLLRTDDPNWSGELASDEINLVEVVLAPRSDFINKTLKEINFRNKYGLSVLSIWRRGAAIRDALGDIPLLWGDAMLVQGPVDKLKLLRADPNVLVLDDAGDTPVLQPRKGPIAALIAVIAAAVATAEIIPIAEAAFAAALGMVLAGCLTMDEAYKSIEWRSIFLISGFIPLGVALDRTGAAALLGKGLVSVLGPFGPVVVAAGLFLATTLFLQVVGNVGAAVIFAPIAISAATQIGSDPRAYAMAVALGASMAFLIPTAHPVNVMMMGPGGYTVRDFTRVGWGLTAALLVVVVVVLPIVWRL